MVTLRKIKDRCDSCFICLSRLREKNEKTKRERVKAPEAHRETGRVVDPSLVYIGVRWLFLELPTSQGLPSYLFFSFNQSTDATATFNIYPLSVQRMRIADFLSSSLSSDALEKVPFFLLFLARDFQKFHREINDFLCPELRGRLEVIF